MQILWCNLSFTSIDFKLGTVRTVYIFVGLILMLWQRETHINPQKEPINDRGPGGDWTHDLQTDIHTYIRAYVQTYIRTYIHICMHTHTHTHSYIRTCVHVYIHMYMYTICRLIESCWYEPAQLYRCRHGNTLLCQNKNMMAYIRRYKAKMYNVTYHSNIFPLCIIWQYSMGLFYLFITHAPLFRRSCNPVTQSRAFHCHFEHTPALRLFTHKFIQAQTKENIKAPCHWPLCGEFTGDRWIPRTKGQ